MILFCKVLICSASSAREEIKIVKSLKEDLLDSATALNELPFVKLLETPPLNPVTELDFAELKVFEFDVFSWGDARDRLQ